MGGGAEGAVGLGVSAKDLLLFSSYFHLFDSYLPFVGWVASGMDVGGAAVVTVELVVESA